MNSRRIIKLYVYNTRIIKTFSTTVRWEMIWPTHAWINIKEMPSEKSVVRSSVVIMSGCLIIWTAYGTRDTLSLVVVLYSCINYPRRTSLEYFFFNTNASYFVSNSANRRIINLFSHIVVTCQTINCKTSVYNDLFPAILLNVMF